MDSLRNRLLSHYGIGKEDYAAYTAEPSFSLIPTIEKETSVIEAKKVIDACIAAKHGILIYGDYDTDGIMATSIIARALFILGVDAKHYIPSRYRDGYGLNLENAKKIAKRGYGLVILVDNGVSCFESVAYLRQEGINVIIIDHHDLPASLPPANALIHDRLIQYGEYPVSAGFLSFLFSIVLLGRVDPYLFVLGAISLISDVMPMLGHNKNSVALALRLIRKHQFPEIMMMTNRTYIDEKILSSEIIPQINAVGRIVTGNEVNRLVDYFSLLEAKDKFPLASWMKEVNAERKAITSNAYSSLLFDDALPGYCLLLDLPEGLNGLLAGRICSDKYKPCLVFSPLMKDNSVLVGSYRGKQGAEFSYLKEKVDPLLLRFGGHAYAAGMSIRKSDFDAFKALFLEFASAHPIVEKEEEPIPILLNEMHMGSYREIRKFGPFGERHREPKFVLADFPTASIRYAKNGTTIKTQVDEKVSILCFRYDEKELKKSAVSFKGSFQVNEFNGNFGLDFLSEILEQGDEHEQNDQ